MIIPMIFFRVKQNLKVLITPPGGDWPKSSRLSQGDICQQVSRVDVQLLVVEPSSLHPVTLASK